MSLTTWRSLPTTTLEWIEPVSIPMVPRDRWRAAGKCLRYAGLDQGELASLNER